MRKLFYLFAVVAIVAFLVGCSDKDDAFYKWKFEFELLEDGGMSADDKKAFQKSLSKAKEGLAFTAATAVEAERIFKEYTAVLRSRFVESLANVVHTSDIVVEVSCASSALAETFVKLIKIPRFVLFDIEFSTGEAVWDEMNPSSPESTLVLNKLGVGTTGTVPYLEVCSSNYWTIKISYPNQDAEGFEPWLDASPIGGPRPGQSVTNVYLEMGENKGYDRSAVLIFTTSTKTYQVYVTQRGPLSDPNER